MDGIRLHEKCVSRRAVDHPVVRPGRDHGGQQQDELFSDALGHSALTGIAIGVLLGVDNYLLSMLGFALLFALCISAVMSSGTSSADTIIGVFSSTGLALGVVLLSATGGFAKYSSYLIGDILTVQPSEIGLLAIVLAAVVIVWILFFNRFLLTSVNTDLAASKNIHTRLMEKLFVVIVAVIVTITIKWVGILIINSLLVLPAASARNLARVCAPIISGRLAFPYSPASAD